jgi:hypothetical protein
MAIKGGGKLNEDDILISHVYGESLAGLKGGDVLWIKVDDLPASPLTEWVNGRFRVEWLIYNLNGFRFTHGRLRSDGQRPGGSEYSRGGAEARRDSEAEDFFFSACSAPSREPALR